MESLAVIALLGGGIYYLSGKARPMGRPHRALHHPNVDMAAAPLRGASQNAPRRYLGQETDPQLGIKVDVFELPSGVLQRRYAGAYNPDKEILQVK